MLKGTDLEKEDFLVGISPKLKKATGSTALSKIINKKIKAKENKRFNFLSKAFQHFHLKHAVISKVENREIVLNGKSVLNFSSGNYLGLELHSKVIEATKHGLDTYGNHTGCSRVFAVCDQLLVLEDEVSQLVGSEKSLIFTNVSQTHEGVIPELFSSKDSAIFIDRYAHTSMYQVSLMAKAKGADLTRVDISDQKKLEKIISKSSKKQKVLLIDGVYSMSGDIPDLKYIDKLCKNYNTILYIDDAHGTGIYGANGGGVVEELGLDFENIILVGSLQKGLGGFGGFVSARQELIDFLRITSKPYIFSGPLQPHTITGTIEAIRICKSKEGHKLRKTLKENSIYIRENLKRLGYEIPNGDSPILPVSVGGDVKTLMSGRWLYDRGICINSVLFPAVPKGEGILRISVTAIQSKEQMDELINAFEEMKEYWDNFGSSMKTISHTLGAVIHSKVKGRNYKGLMK